MIRVSDSASLNPIIRHISPVQSDPSVVPGTALLSRGVSIKGSVKFLNQLLLDGEVEGTIVSTGTLTIGETFACRAKRYQRCNRLPKVSQSLASRCDSRLR